MLKQKEYKWEDTNVALIGSDADIQARLESAETEKAWDGVGNKPELKVWRIEKFKVVAWPKSKYGKFHEGDSYIVLHTYKPKPDEEKLLFDIHFWIGAESTQDEYGTAAYKTVELDAKLEDAAVQHREVQDHESKAFLKLFGGNVEYLEGGVETGFNHWEPTETPAALYRVKGTKESIELKEVKVRRDHMNSGDVFVLDVGLTIYQWNGKNSNPNEKLKAGAFLDSIVSARGGDTKKIVMDEGQSDDVPEFWDRIPGTMMGCIPLSVKAEAGSDDDVKAFRKVLYRLTDRTGDLKFKRVKRASPGNNTVERQRLDSEDVFILDDGFIVWVWIGKGASSAEKGQGMAYAMRYLKKFNRPSSMPITQVRDGAEPLTFLEHLNNDNVSSCTIQ